MADLSLDPGATDDARRASLRHRLTFLANAAEAAIRDLEAIPRAEWSSEQRAGFVLLLRRSAAVLRRLLYDGGRCRVCDGSARKHYEGCDGAALLAELEQATRNDPFPPSRAIVIAEGRDG